MATLNKQVAATADSGNIYPSALDTTEGWLGWDGSVLNSAFSRFTGITIPQGAVITSAKIQYKAISSTGLSGLQTTIYASKELNAAAPTTYAAYNAKTVTTAAVNWDAPGAWASGTWYDSPDITSVIQEIVSQGSWASGNALLILHKNRKPSGTQSTVLFNVYANGAANAPKLVINYSTVDNRNGTLVITDSSDVSAAGKKGAKSTIPIPVEHALSFLSIKQAYRTFAMSNSQTVYFVGKNRTGNFWIVNASDMTMSRKKGAKLSLFNTNNHNEINAVVRKNSFGVIRIANSNMVLIGVREVVVDGEIILYLVFDTVTEINDSYDA